MSSARYAPSLTFASVKAALADRGMSITKDTTLSDPTGSGEYRVTFKVAPWLNMTAKRAEDMAYYASDLEDAFQTGTQMAMDMAAKVGMPNVRRS